MRASEGEIAARLRSAGRFTPEGLESTSLAGLQPKIMLHGHAGRWSFCRDGAASTHILKLGHHPDSAIADVVDTEAAALALAQAG